MKSDLFLMIPGLQVGIDPKYIALIKGSAGFVDNRFALVQGVCLTGLQETILALLAGTDLGGFVQVVNLFALFYAAFAAFLLHPVPFFVDLCGCILPEKRHISVGEQFVSRWRLIDFILQYQIAGIGCNNAIGAGEMDDLVDNFFFFAVCSDQVEQIPHPSRGPENR